MLKHTDKTVVSLLGIVRAFRFAFLIIFISGCAHTQIEKYPNSWPAPVSLAVKSCPNVSGQYGFSGSQLPRDFQAERALSTLNALAGFQGILPIPNRVEISHNENKWFLIRTFVENKLVLTREFTNANATMRCEADGLFLKAPPLEQKIDGISQTIRMELHFNTAEDGSLVFREEYWANSWILWVPVIGSEVRWNRLSRIQQ